MKKPKDRATITTRGDKTTIRATGKAAGILFRLFADSRRQDKEDEAAEVAEAAAPVADKEKGGESP